MNTQEYQKSTLKLLDFLVHHADREFIIEELIHRLKIGRSLTFAALRQLEADSLIRTATQGKQRQVFFIASKENLSLKLFFDQLHFQSLSKEIKLSLTLFVSQVTLPLSMVLFGSALSKPKPNDLDLLVFYSKEIDRSTLKKIKEDIEALCNQSINLHFIQKPETEILLNGICLYNPDFYLETLEKQLNENRRRAEEKLLQSARWCSSLFHNLSEPDCVDILDKVLVEFSFLYSFLQNQFGLSKEEAKILFYSSPYKKDLKKLEKIKDNFKKFEAVRRIFKKLGEEFV